VAFAVVVSSVDLGGGAPKRPLPFLISTFRAYSRESNVCSAPSVGLPIKSRELDIAVDVDVELAVGVECGKKAATGEAKDHKPLVQRALHSLSISYRTLGGISRSISG
jgi:hypothetical protein